MGLGGRYRRPACSVAQRRGPRVGGRAHFRWCTVRVGVFLVDIPKAMPFFDTNMHRVLHRVFFGPDVPAATAKPKEVMDLAADLVPPGRGWAWNQAVMEFGALRCTARGPGCEGCPLADRCKARPKMLEALATAPRAEKGGGSEVRGHQPVPARQGARPPARSGGPRRSGPARALTRAPRGRGEPGAPQAKGGRREPGARRAGQGTRQGERPEARPAGAVAEERAPYSTGVGQEEPGEIRVSLP